MGRSEKVVPGAVRDNLYFENFNRAMLRGMSILLPEAEEPVQNSQRRAFPTGEFCRMDVSAGRANFRAGARENEGAIMIDHVVTDRRVCRSNGPKSKNGSSIIFRRRRSSDKRALSSPAGSHSYISCVTPQTSAPGDSSLTHVMSVNSIATPILATIPWRISLTAL